MRKLGVFTTKTRNRDLVPTTRRVILAACVVRIAKVDFHPFALVGQSFHNPSSFFRPCGNDDNITPSKKLGSVAVVFDGEGLELAPDKTLTQDDGRVGEGDGIVCIANVNGLVA